MSKVLFDIENKMNRRHFFTKTSLGLGAMALGALGGAKWLGGQTPAPAFSEATPEFLLGQLPHFAPKAKRVIYLFMSGGPSQMDLFDYKPDLEKMHGQELPDSVRQGQRLTGMSAGQSALPMAASAFGFKQHGRSG
ncbi:MAG: DUF1501 domain-containing protein, partial [Lewinella sp.]|nr:DUF1501 domain-containing protein [Lewinella sp.]